MRTALVFIALVALGAPAGATTLEALVARCAPNVAPRTALAVIAVESGGRWWAVGDNDRPTPAFAGPGEALAYARRRIAAGGSIDIGLTQLNSAHLTRWHLPVDAAFAPCTNVALGMTVLAEAWASAQRRYGQTPFALVRAFEAYNGGERVWTTADAGLRRRVARYAATVWATATALGPAPARAALPSTPSPHRVRILGSTP